MKNINEFAFKEITENPIKLDFPYFLCYNSLNIFE